MGKRVGIMAGLAVSLVMAIVKADDPPSPTADFKIQVGSFGLKTEPVSTEEIVIRQGRAYVFASDTKEVIVIEPARKRLELVDVGRKLQSELTFRTLDDSLEKLKEILRKEAGAREKQGGRGNAIEAKMARDLFETKLSVTPGTRPNRLRLTNPAVEVDADGEPEADAARLAMMAVTLNTIARLGAFRAPADLPPFVELEAIAALTGERRLRPTELSYLYRLAGPPQKIRRTYKLVPNLTDREVEATARVDRLRQVVPSVRWGQYRPSR